MFPTYLENIDSDGICSLLPTCSIMFEYVRGFGTKGCDV